MNLPISAKSVVRYVPIEFDLPGAEARLLEQVDVLNRMASDAAPEDKMAVARKRVGQLEDLARAVRARVEEKDGKVPIFLLGVPSSFEKAEWRRAVAAVPCRFPNTTALLDTARDVLRDLEPENLAYLLELCDQAEHAAGPGAPALDEAFAQEWAALEEVLAREPRYAAILADRRHWLDVAPMIAAQHFLIGWENVGFPFKRARRGYVSESLIERIGEGWAREIGMRAIELMSINKATEKNSASPSPSTTSPAPIAAGNDRPTADRDGSSSESSSPQTQD